MTAIYRRAIETLNKHWEIVQETGMTDGIEYRVTALAEAGLLALDILAAANYLEQENK